MTTPGPTRTLETTLARDILDAVRYYFGGRRRALLILAGFTLLTGLALNWNWLVAAGIAPILISILPCAAMCALGLCMNRASGRSCVRDASGRETKSVDASPGPAPGQLPPPELVASPQTEFEPQPPKERSMNDA